MNIDMTRVVTDESYWTEIGAPDDATHFLPADERFEATWYKEEEGVWLGWLVEGDESWDPCPRAVEAGRHLVPRPSASH